MKKRILSVSWAALPLLLLLAACDPFGTNPRPQPEPSPDEVEGYAPVYASAESAGKIAAEDVRPIEKGGKIYVKGNMLYQVEVGKGIHVININDGSNPQKLKFIHVTGAQEMSIMDNYMYTNHMNDLVVLDIADINNVQLVDRVSGMFHLVDPALPPAAGWFECVDESKGVVVGWELKKLYKPVCRKN